MKTNSFIHYKKNNKILINIPNFWKVFRICIDNSKINNLKPCNFKMKFEHNYKIITKL